MDWIDRFGGSMRMLAMTCLAITHLALADPAPDPTSPCRVATSQQAKSLADVLYEKQEYQRAGECYEAAGEPSRAQLAYLKAVRPNSEAAARGLREQQDTARALAFRVAQAFRGDH
jgi:hypothetical protein